MIRSSTSMEPGPHSSPPEGSPPERAFQAYEEDLYRFLLRCSLGRRELAEDVLRETLRQARRHVDRLSPDSEAVRSWLFTIARRVAIEHSRTREHRPAGIAPSELPVRPRTDDAAGNHSDTDTAQRALQRLNTDHRRVIVELYQRRRTVSEVARRLGIPESAVKARAYHGLRAMRASMG